MQKSCVELLLEAGAAANAPCRAIHESGPDFLPFVTPLEMAMASFSQHNDTDPVTHSRRVREIVQILLRAGATAVPIGALLHALARI